MEKKPQNNRLTEGVSKNVVALGAVSGLTDVSSEMLYPVMPLFITAVLGAPVSAVGLIEGCAEATASLLNAASGYWSDHFKKRKPFVLWGYSLSAVSKPLMALAFGWPMVLLARITDRAGKGLRGSARDAIIAASTNEKHRGKAFGLHRAMDTLGAAIGPAVALVLLSGFGLGYRTVFLLAFVPAAAGVWVLAKYVKEPAAPPAEKQTARVPFFKSLKTLSPELKTFLAYYAVFALGNSSDVFLLLKAKNTGFSVTHVVLAYIGYNLVYALCAAPAGWLSDKLGRKKTLAFGMCIFAAVYAGFALAKSPAAIWILFAVYGFYAAFNEGIAKALVTDISGQHNRATALGSFAALAGIMALFTSVLAGLLWDFVSPSAPFVLGALCAAVSALLIARMKTAPAA